jgi:predicted negative regulator of RcsB-dependent stress response
LIASGITSGIAKIAAVGLLSIVILLGWQLRQARQEATQAHSEVARYQGLTQSLQSALAASEAASRASMNSLKARDEQVKRLAKENSALRKGVNDALRTNKAWADEPLPAELSVQLNGMRK